MLCGFIAQRGFLGKARKTGFLFENFSEANHRQEFPGRCSVFGARTLKRQTNQCVYREKKLFKWGIWESLENLNRTIRGVAQRFRHLISGFHVGIRPKQNNEELDSIATAGQVLSNRSPQEFERNSIGRYWKEVLLSVSAFIGSEHASGSAPSD